MAHEVQPIHVPHDQLRTEAPRRRQQTDKYVSAFVSSSADVDMTFRTPILPKSSDHFKVGIDELTVNLGNLSMLEYGTNDVVFRVIRRGNNNADFSNTQFHMIDGPAGELSKWRDAFEFKVDRPYLTILEVLSRFDEIATAVGTYIRTEGLVQPGGGPGLWTLTQAAGTDFEFFKTSLSDNGQMKFHGNRIFWANFSIEVPLAKYRAIIFKDSTQSYLSMHPGTGDQIIEPYEAAGNGLDADDLNPVWDEVVGDLADTDTIVYVSAGNLLNTLDRRVTLEVGCSLPIKNSPLVDHGEEAPDFVLGRYMFHQPYSISQDSITVPHLGTITVQGPKDRVVFHHLAPQQKIQVLRLKLWARVRTYNVASKTWGMKTIVCPVEDTDYWHIRLHFVEK